MVTCESAEVKDCIVSGLLTYVNSAWASHLSPWCPLEPHACELQNFEATSSRRTRPQKVSSLLVNQQHSCHVDWHPSLDSWKRSGIVVFLSSLIYLQ